MRHGMDRVRLDELHLAQEPSRHRPGIALGRGDEALGREDRVAVSIQRLAEPRRAGLVIEGPRRIRARGHTVGHTHGAHSAPTPSSTDTAGSPAILARSIGITRTSGRPAGTSIFRPSANSWNTAGVAKN
jgi:hypothetical protein